MKEKNRRFHAGLHAGQAAHTTREVKSVRDAVQTQADRLDRNADRRLRTVFGGMTAQTQHTDAKISAATKQILGALCALPEKMSKTLAGMLVAMMSTIRGLFTDLSAKVDRNHTETMTELHSIRGTVEDNNRMLRDLSSGHRRWSDLIVGAIVGIIVFLASATKFWNYSAAHWLVPEYDGAGNYMGLIPFDGGIRNVVAVLIGLALALAVSGLAVSLWRRLRRH